MKMNPLLNSLKSLIKFLLISFLLLVFLDSPTIAQERRVTGTVISAEDNTPMPGVNVVIRGRTTGTTTDVNGKYFINVPENAILVFTFIGYTTKEVAVGGNTVVDVALTPEVTQLGEIVITALGIAKDKKALTYAAQNIDAGILQESRELNAINALGGKVAGLDLVRSNAGVGSASRVVLRGNRSIAGNNQPLYVVDGVPIQNNTVMVTFGEGGGLTSSDGISNINPDDIENVTVLKGASATALYGTRANNGAVIITTKKGAVRQGIGVEYALNYSVESPVILSKFQNVYGQGSQGIYAKNSEFDWGPKLDGRLVEHWTPDMNSPKYGTTYPFVAHPNNLKEYFQLGTNMVNSLALSSGNEKLQTYFSYTNTQSRGIIRNNELQRHNVNIRVSSKLSNRLSADSKLTFYHHKINNRVSTGDDFYNPMRAILRQPTNISTEEAKVFEYFDNAGFRLQNYWNPHSNGGENPWWMVNRVLSEELRDRVIGMALLKYEIMKGLSFQVRSAIDYAADNYNRKTYNDTYTIADRGNYEVNKYLNYEMNNDLLLNYTNNFGSFSVNASAGANWLTQQYLNNSIGAGRVLLKPNLFTFSNAGALGASEDGATKKLNSVYGFATLGYKNYLFLDLTARNDWSSTLPPENWSYFYPSVGLTWVVSDMLKNLPVWLTFTKLRASWAQVGNDTDPYQLAPQFSFYQGGPNGYASRGGTKPATDLKPEITTSREIGADIRFFNNRLGIDFTWYKSNSKNQLLNVSLPVASGYSSKFINAGNIQNSGFEIILNATPAEGEFTWDISLNWAMNNSKVVEITKDMDQYPLTGRQWMTTQVIKKGEEYGLILTKKFLRNDAGRVLIASDGKPLVSDGQTEPGGTYNPDWIAGLTNTFTWKDFDLQFMIDFRQGGVIYSFTEANLASDGFSEYTLEGRDGFVVDGVLQADGSENNIEITSEEYWQHLGGRNTPTGEPFCYDASNARLRSANLGYTHKLKSGPLRSLRLSIEGRNLFFLYNKAKYVDPNLSSGNTNVQGVEGFGLPSTRSIGMNLRLTF